MKPSQIYALSTYKKVDLWSFVDHRDMIELTEFVYQIDHDKNTRIEVREHYYWCEDGRRSIVIDTVWLDHHPVMVLRAAGREGRDYCDRFITDARLFAEIVIYLRSIADVESPEVISADSDIKALDVFYNQDMRIALGIPAVTTPTE